MAVEGNIGSGKSTCLEYFKKQKQVEVIYICYVFFLYFTCMFGVIVEIQEFASECKYVKHADHVWLKLG